MTKESVKKYCDAEVESWTLAVAVSGRVYLAQDGDTTYQSQVIDTATPPAPTQPAFPTAASVFGTPPQKSVFGTPIVPSPPTFQFGTLKLQFGNMPPQPPALPFKFGSVKKKEDTKKAVEKSTEDKKTKVDQAKPARRKVLLFASRARGGRRKLRSAVVETSKVTSSKTEEEEDEEEEEEKEDKAISFEAEEVPLPPPDPPTKKALSPAVAECQRAVYAAFLWQEGLVYDAIVSALYLKFHPKLSKEMKREQKTEKEEKTPVVKEKEEEGGPAEEGKGSEEVEEDSIGEVEKESGEKKVKSPSGLVLSMEADPQPSSSSLPPTLNHLVTFWDEISTRVLDNSSIAFPPPKVPPLAQELQKRYEDEKKEIDKRKKEKDKKVSPQAGGGSTVCELCEQTFPDPVTYHMKDIHPGCGKHASGWGYNSRGTFCSGWAGNCGDGGRGGSTWYLMCKDCHTKYLAMKNEVKKKTLRPAPLPKMKTKKPGKARSLPVVSAVQGMIQNAKFLLEISCPTDNKPATTPTAILSPSAPTMFKQSSIPCPNKADQETSTASSSETVLPDRPALLRSISARAPQSPLLATKSKVLRPQRILSSSTEDDDVHVHVHHQQSMDSPIFTSDETSMGLVFKPSINLARLMYNRSMHSADSKEVGYGKVMAFVLQYHDLNGLRMAMKQSMRVAGIRAFAMEVRNCHCIYFLYL